MDNTITATEAIECLYEMLNGQTFPSPKKWEKAVEYAVDCIRKQEKVKQYITEMENANENQIG